jgi:hypothetical protein
MPGLPTNCDKYFHECTFDLLLALSDISLALMPVYQAFIAIKPIITGKNKIEGGI